MNCSRSRWQKKKTAAHAAGCRAYPAPDADRELQPTSPATVQTQPRQPPTSVAALGVRHFPIRESALLSVTSLWSDTVADQTRFRRAGSVEQPCRTRWLPEGSRRRQVFFPPCLPFLIRYGANVGESERCRSRQRSWSGVGTRRTAARAPPTS